MNNQNKQAPNIGSEEIAAMLKNAEKATATGSQPAENDPVDTTTRKVLVIGCGGGGCNISTIITERVPMDVYTIAYDTSVHNMDRNVTANKKGHVDGQDGAGKSRDFSKKIFKDGTYKTLIDYVNAGIDALGNVDYILITTTADGGTGSGMSVVMAKFLKDNYDIPVIVLGVYPVMTNDAQSQYNAMEWQTELTKVGIPHFILDNDIAGKQSTEVDDAKLAEIYRKVNEQAARIGGLLTGTNFGPSTIGMIDRRNLLMLTMKYGGRMVATSDTTRPAAGQTLDDYIEQMLQKSCQPLPYGVSGIGVWVKGSKEMLGQMDTSLPQLQKKYGEAILKFAHVEESSETEIGIIMTGCDECRDRLMGMRHRYDDIMSSKAKKESCTNDLMAGIANPMGGDVGGMFKGAGSNDGELDTSALDL